MHPKGAILFKLLLNKYHSGKEDALIKQLKEEDANPILALRFQANDLQLAFTKLDEWVKSMHYSWLKESFVSLPSAIRNVLLQALPQEHILGLCPEKAEEDQLQQVIDIALDLPISSSAEDETSPSPPEPSPSDEQALDLLDLSQESHKQQPKPNNKPLSKAHLFLLNQLYAKWPYKNLLPKALLPQTPLFGLLSLSKIQCIQLIDLLSMYDLGEEMRYIVDKKALQKLLAYLSVSQQQFLKMNMHHKHRGPLAGINKLAKLEGDELKIKKILHKQGLQRLAIGLSGQNPDFIQNLSLKMDIGRGTILLKTVQKEEIPGSSTIIAQQILQAFNFLQPKVRS